jgi:hypothetical protein
MDVVPLPHIVHLFLARMEPANYVGMAISASTFSSLSSLASLVSQLPQQLNGQPPSIANQKGGSHHPPSL